jgi:class 3 adenylate cyclase
VLFAPAFVSHLDFLWADPAFVRFVEGLGRFSRVILYDKPGTGLSDPIAHVPTLEEQAQDMLAVLDAAGSQRAVLIGYSASGPPCVLLSAGEPERIAGLILACSAVRFPRRDAPDLPDGVTPGLIAEIEEEFDAVTAHWGEGLLVRMFAPSIDSPLQRRFWARFERVSASPSMLKGLVDSFRGLDVREIATTVEQPALVISLSEDRVPVEAGREAADLIPNARFVEFPGHDHAFWFAENDAIVDTIEEFVTGARTAPVPESMVASVLFTDIVDSTALASELGDSAWGQLISRHNALVENRVARARGRVIKFIGDGSLCSFPGPVAAVECAEELCREARASLGIALRAGVHIGECQVVGDDLVGLAVHIAARITSRSGADEVLVSAAVRQLASASGLEFDARGSHELKGVPGRWELYALDAPSAAQRIAIDQPAIRPRVGDRTTVALARHAPRTLRLITRIIRRPARTAER